MMTVGTFLQFTNGPMSHRPPLVNMGPWPPPDRIAVQVPPGSKAALVTPLAEEADVPEGAMAYRMVARSQLKPGRGLLVGAQYALDGP